MWNSVLGVGEGKWGRTYIGDQVYERPVEVGGGGGLLFPGLGECSGREVAVPKAAHLVKTHLLKLCSKVSYKLAKG